MWSTERAGDDFGFVEEDGGSSCVAADFVDPGLGRRCLGFEQGVIGQSGCRVDDLVDSCVGGADRVVPCRLVELHEYRVASTVANRDAVDLHGLDVAAVNRIDVHAVLVDGGRGC